MSDRDQKADDEAVRRAKGADVDGLKTLPDVWTPQATEKAGTGEPVDDGGTAD
ncbi:hypothetical protein [Frondihabitans peucedani]|uniref:Uncharacterized protein n=1 Tax=Frondihabitans peucedani TaxID=598626 RepID=A0ABP8E3E5_9MICO